MTEDLILNSHNKQEYPPMHTAEHLITGEIARMLGCGRAFSTHIEKKKSKCDFRYPRNLTLEELKQVEQAVNEQIAAGVDVRVEMLGVEEAAVRYSLSRLPDEANGVRIVHVGDFDSCPCIGDHVSNTSEIPPVTLISSDCTEGVLRVRFKFNKG